MKIESPTPFVFVIGLLIFVPGCGRKIEVDIELKNAAIVLQQSEPVQASTPRTGQSLVAPTSSPVQELNQAAAAYKGGNFDEAVTRLQLLRAQPSMTPEQRIAVNDAIAAVMTEIQRLADKGDARAISAIKQYETMQNRQR